MTLIGYSTIPYLAHGGLVILRPREAFVTCIQYIPSVGFSGIPGYQTTANQDDVPAKTFRFLDQSQLRLWVYKEALRTAQALRFLPPPQQYHQEEQGEEPAAAEEEGGEGEEERRPAFGCSSKADGGVDRVCCGGRETFRPYVV